MDRRPCSRVPRGGGTGDDRRLDHSNGANCCDAEESVHTTATDRHAASGSHCGDNCYGLWAMLPRIPCVFCFDCKFTCEPWLGCAWDG